jgi:hypothetical protein
LLKEDGASALAGEFTEEFGDESSFEFNDIRPGQRPVERSGAKAAAAKAPAEENDDFFV